MIYSFLCFLNKTATSKMSIATLPGGKVHKLLTLVLLKDGVEPRILLGKKKRGFGEGKWNGFGGKVEPGESVIEGAIREMQEECNLTVEKLSRRGVLTFDMKGDNMFLEVHVFGAKEYSGNVEETEEMQPKWFNFSDVPYESMWLDDKHWLPIFLEEESTLFRGKFVFEGQEELVSIDVDKKVTQNDLDAVRSVDWRRPTN
eukprot:m.344040 g.344040  ORF g.344040 m.344040 type:complete len:201 (+) comp23767_c0_seq1:118-720(+)